MSLSRGRGAALAALLAIVGGYFAFDFLRGPHGSVTIGTSLGARHTDQPVLHANEPFRAVLGLNRNLGDDARIDFEVHRVNSDNEGDEKQILMYTIPTEQSRDEIYVGWKSTEKLVHDTTGRYRVRFLQNGRLLGEGSFTVAP